MSHKKQISNSSPKHTLNHIPICTTSSKAQTAASVIKSVNEAIRCKAYTSKVSLETEATFNYSFWAKQDLILTALDNVDARLYIDSQVTSTSSFHFMCFSTIHSVFIRSHYFPLERAVRKVDD